MLVIRVLQNIWLNSKVSELSSRKSKRERLREFRKPATCTNKNWPLQVASWLHLRLLGRFLYRELS